MDSLGNQVHPVVQMCPNDDTVFMMLFKHTARSVQSRYEQHEDALQHLWPAQPPDLNISEQLWSVKTVGWLADSILHNFSSK